MQLDKQVVSLDLARKLRELGAPQDSYFVHCKIGEFDETIWRNYLTLYDGIDTESVFAAYTVTELGELLPWYIEKTIPTTREVTSFYLEIYKDPEWTIQYRAQSNGLWHAVSHKGQVEAYGLMLAWLITQGDWQVWGGES